MRNIFRKQNTLDINKYCIHMATGGPPLGDMCESCCNDREEQWDFKFWDLIFKLPFSLGYKLAKIHERIKYRNNKEYWND